MTAEQLEALRAQNISAYQDTVFSNPIVQQVMSLQDEGLSEEDCMRMAIVQLSKTMGQSMRADS